MDFRCDWCDDRLPIAARLDARFCSSRCRVASHRATVPRELKAAPRWIRHVSKRPVTSAGRQASSTNSATWSTYTVAAAATVGNGLGFVLNGDGIVCVDLDHCLVDGRPNAVTAGLLARLPETYIEVSPSGDGLHVWGRADVPVGRKGSRDGQQVEVYGNGRYMTVTRRRFGACRPVLADLSGVLEFLMPS